jgi:2-oxoglutarate dehydrogenase E1 component
MDNHQFTNRQNLEYIEQLYQQYKAQPESLTSDWKMFFQGFEFAQNEPFGLSNKELDVYRLITAYRNFGHFEAQLDPLTNSSSPSNELALPRFNLKDADLEQSFQIGSIVGMPNAKLRDIIARLKNYYCGRLTVQASEALPDIRQFFITEFEKNPNESKLKPEEKKSIFECLTKTEGLEKFLHTRFVGTKRFSVEGGDALLPMLQVLSERCPAAGVEELVMGMAHRGRINTLINFMDKSVAQILAEFSGPVEYEEHLDFYDSDVKYHLGYKTQKKVPGGTCDVTLAYNPSHLEAVNPVVLGMARAAQRIRKDSQKRSKVLPILIHGDAAFAGQGIVTEILQMSQVRGYKVGGTLHIVVDNQVGFTTNPENSRSSHYASDIAKAIAIPVLHVNGDDVESCIRAVDIALRFRQQYAHDIVINMVCYRRFGHNEGDEPAYTQPQMYEIIKKHPSLREIYAKQIQREGILTQAQCEALFETELNRLQGILDNLKKNPIKIPAHKVEGSWKALRRAKAEDFANTVDTTFDLVSLQKIGNIIAGTPKSFNPHPKLLKLLETRKLMAEGKEPIDWGMGELLAYGSLLHEGNSVRLTGQDCCRGTFTHRHAVLYDHKSGEPYNALDTINGDKVEFCVYDSILSEYGVLGFEYGNSITDPTFLSLWEAQFGDFANGAQIIIDQFIAAGESKWQQMSGIVMLLPHSYEGQGPEHSSARLERFLQLAAQYNIQICNLTTPAQVFHAFRRQMKRPFRKPLIIMSPKLLLRHPKAVSSLNDFAKGTFLEVIEDASADNSKVDTILLCSGKIYYELVEERLKKKDAHRFAIIRLEQIYPFPFKRLAEAIKKFPKIKTLAWAQEEPKNNGAWTFVYFKIKELFDNEKIQKISIGYAGRNERSSPAVGSIHKHKLEQQAILEDAFKF